ncbi:MAG TPA: glycosyltransferase family 2 protein, partial [Candidatus Omnitrophica bacterium]|nr:glycosyltransferase family 2 protein [Candidatus Omnitrophota bacterium]
MSSRRNPCSLTIFFPCYNDAGTIGTLVVAATLVAGEFTDDYEILVVDDGSTDRSVELLQQLQKDYARLRLVCHPTNQGYGAALRTGFAQATKDLIFYTDGDGQYDVLELRALLPLLQEG